MIYDAVIIGAGPGGRAVARTLAAEGWTTAMIERELVGGECPFWACIPSKTLLRPVELQHGVRHFPGLSGARADWEAIAAYRDYMNSGLDDTEKTEAHERMGIEVIHGDGRVEGAGIVSVGGRRLETERIVVATGTTNAIPSIDGLDKVPYWTNREATALAEVPRSAIVLGGGPVGIELGQLLAGFGASVTIVEGGERLVAREEPAASELLARLLGHDGIELRLNASAKGVEPADAGVRVTLGDGDQIEAERLVVAVGRAPRTHLGLENAGLEPSRKGIEVDDRCRAGNGVWAVGDVTGVAQFTHVASYQGRIAAANMLGHDARADYRAVPRVVFCEPELAAVGLTSAQAEEQGIATEAAEVDLGELDRTETYGRDLEGRIGVLADRDRRVLVGAWAIGPLAGEWIHPYALAIKAGVSIDVLCDSVAQFPTFSEGMVAAARSLEL